MILEFTGLSGAGKTTSEPYIISDLQQRGYQVVLRSELRNSYIKKKICPYYEANRGFRILSNRLYNLGSWQSLIGADLDWRIIRGTFSRPRRKSLLWLGEDIKLSIYFLHEFKSSVERPSVYIPHEGFVHHIAYCTALGGIGFSGLSLKLLKIFPADKIMIIFFKISVEEALDRVFKRGLPQVWPGSINSRARVKEFLLRFNEAIEDSVAKCQESGVKVQPIDASLDPKQVQSRIGAILDIFPQYGYTGRTEKLGKHEEYTKGNPR